MSNSQKDFKVTIKEYVHGTKKDSHEDDKEGIMTTCI